jgi:N-methylhydantoinase A
MDLLINIDNGGTLTDFCVIDGARTFHTKTLTTPHDLSQCLFEGLVKVSKDLYGDEDLLKLLVSTKYIRYSTTQGTNSIVERKGPRLGMILGGGLSRSTLCVDSTSSDMFNDLINERTEQLPEDIQGEQFEAAAIAAVNALSAAGANRVIVAWGGPRQTEAEAAVKRVLLKAFPPHLLGAIPILYAHEVVDDPDVARCAWTAIFNSFLHPAMERFLYSAEHKLRGYRTQNPLLIFRNDGHSARVAKTIAVKTYSSGPRGGMEGARSLAAHYGFEQLLSMDVGGTTTDIGMVEHGSVRAASRGRVQGIATSFAMSDVVSAGVGGSSIIRVVNNRIVIGPDSVGSTPGPACFALGGTAATITDAFLLGGLLDAESYFGGQLKLDRERARAAIAKHVCEPMGISEVDAALATENAWVAKIADELKNYSAPTPRMTLAAFGGAGPFVACAIAGAAGIGRILVPGLAAVFSAYGVGFSDVGHEFSAPLPGNDAQSLGAVRALLLEKATRSMFAEGITLDECEIRQTLSVSNDAHEYSLDLRHDDIPAGIADDSRVSLTLVVTKPTPRPQLTGNFTNRARLRAERSSLRTIMVERKLSEVPLYRVKDLAAGAGAPGPAVLEDDFFTCRIDPAWQFEINDGRDILLTQRTETTA